jgi:hypothetical protein
MQFEESDFVFLILQTFATQGFQRYQTAINTVLISM